MILRVLYDIHAVLSRERIAAHVAGAFSDESEHVRAAALAASAAIVAAAPLAAAACPRPDLPHAY